MGDLEITLKPPVKDLIDLEEIRAFRDNNAIIIVVPGCSTTPDIEFAHVTESMWTYNETKVRTEEK